jgi:hypothetical protein
MRKGTTATRYHKHGGQIRAQNPYNPEKATTQILFSQYKKIPSAAGLQRRKHHGKKQKQLSTSGKLMADGARHGGRVWLTTPENKRSHRDAHLRTLRGIASKLKDTKGVERVDKYLLDFDVTLQTAPVFRQRDGCNEQPQAPTAQRSRPPVCCRKSAFPVKQPNAR